MSRTERRRASAAARSVPFALALLALAPAPGRAEEAAFVQLGETRVLALRAPHGERTPRERAEFAERTLAETLLDPACGADSFATTEVEPGRFRIEVCRRTVLEAGADDALAEGLLDTRALAERWTDALREAWTADKAKRYSRKLLEAALLGLLYPLVFLVLVALVHVLVKRAAQWLERLGGERGLRLGPLVLTAEEGDRGLLSRLLRSVGGLVYLLLAWVFLIAFFERFPGTARWAREMLALLRDLASGAGFALLGLVPRLIALLLLVVLARIALGSVGRLFAQVRARKFRLDPILTPDTAGPAEVTARAAVVAAAVFAAALLVPGEAGTALLAAFALFGLALALGARPVAESFLAGLVILYGRPFRTGDAIRLRGWEGVVERKGFLYLQLRLRDGRRALVPNRRVSRRVLQVVDPASALRLRAVLRPTRENAAPEGLFRHAAAEAGLRRESGDIRLVAVRAGDLVYSVAWSLPDSADFAEARHGFLRSLVERGPGLGVEVVSVREDPGAG